MHLSIPAISHREEVDESDLDFRIHLRRRLEQGQPVTCTRLG